MGWQSPTVLLWDGSGFPHSTCVPSILPTHSVPSCPSSIPWSISHAVSRIWHWYVYRFFHLLRPLSFFPLWHSLRWTPVRVVPSEFLWRALNDPYGLVRDLTPLTFKPLPQRNPMQDRMTEADHNSLRNLIGRLREENPQEWVSLLFQSMLNRMDENAITMIRHTDDDSIPDAALLVFHGYAPTKWADSLVTELNSRIRELQGTQDSTDTEDGN